MPNSVKINITNEELDGFIKDATMNCLGYIKVENYGGCYATMDRGIYVVEKYGHKEQIAKNRKALYSIFKKLIGRYLNFERNGYFYYYHRGTWHKEKRDTVRKP